VGHIRIDVHKKESQLCILTEAGDVIERRIRTERTRLAAVLGERAPARVGTRRPAQSAPIERTLSRSSPLHSSPRSLARPRTTAQLG
jgi:hypothetical protein